MGSFRVVVDGGQSGTRLRLRSPDGFAADSVAAPISTDRPVVTQVAEHVSALIVARELGLSEVAVGLSGLTSAERDADALRDALAPLGVRRVAMAHDSVSGFLGANRLAQGAVAAVGTGVVVLGVGERAVARVDGWGYLFGDAGSAFWIGRAGIAAAMESFDGRGQATALLGAVERQWGDPRGVYVVLQADPGRVTLVAAFAREVAAIAEAGDRVALGILETAGGELARATLAAVRRAGSTDARVSWVGRVLTANDTVRGRFVRDVTAGVPDALIAPPLGEPIDGVELLFEVPSGHPLRPHIAVVG